MERLYLYVKLKIIVCNVRAIEIGVYPDENQALCMILERGCPLASPKLVREIFYGVIEITRLVHNIKNIAYKTIAQ